MRALVMTLVVVSGLGCVKRYDTAPALAFDDLPYAWPTKNIELPKAQAKYQLSHAPKLSYVELNPEGAQTVVFLHGLGSYLKFWRAQLDATAAQGFRVIAIDQLGFGKSDKPAQFPYTTESFAENVVEVLDALQIDRAILVGHSMGGQTALSTAIRFPEKVSALVLAAPAGFEPFSKREQKWFKNVYSRGLVKEADEEAIWGAIRFQNFQHWTSEHEWLIEERVRLAKNATFDQYAYAQVRTVEGLARNDFVRESLEKIAVPTVIIHGSADRLIPNAFLHGGFSVDVMKVGHDAIKGSALVTLDGCGHTVQLECSEQFNAALFGFLKKLPAPAQPVEPPAPQ